jgi:hypothetical protein
MSNSKKIAETLVNKFLEENLISGRSKDSIISDISKGNLTAGDWVTLFDLKITEDQNQEEE